MIRAVSLVLAFAAAACATADTKVGPDEGEAGSESTISTYYTTIIGSLALDTPTFDAINYADWFLGRTLELREGQALELVVASTRKSTIHFYGPAHAFSWDGEPRFRAPLVRAATKPAAGAHVAIVRVTAPADGTYMLVYGPDHVWAATYRTSATCTANCTAFSDEGAACGGFVPADLSTTCAPELACVAPHDVIADVPGNCGVMVTVAALLADPSAYEGRFVAVRGAIARRPPGCTKIGCSITNPCCNQCFASLNLFDHPSEASWSTGVELAEGGGPLACAGNSCDYQNHCSVETGNYWVAGWFTLQDGVTPMLDLVRRYPAP